jgi:hypothetical protein
MMDAVDYDKMKVGETNHVLMKESGEYEEVDATYSGPRAHAVIAVTKNLTGPTFKVEASAALFATKTDPSATRGIEKVDA